jgi:16S rRNA (guanine527-N7)-methyltransferase
MTEDDARARIAQDVSRETLGKLDRIGQLVATENQIQNLIAPSTVNCMWSRHILDSAQLVWMSKDADGLWVDIGSGGGFPGLVVGAMRQSSTVLCEPRRKRAAFLDQAVLGVGIAERVSVHASRIETMRIDGSAAIISARAVAGLSALFGMASHLAGPDTLWLLPKGRSAEEEVAEARRDWQGDIRLAPSLSDPESLIVLARDVRRIRR